MQYCVRALSRQSRARGFTLVEMMVTLAVMAVLAAVAVPMYTNTVRAMRVTSAADLLADSIEQARNQARHFRQPVILQSINCALGDWGCGWILYFDRNGNGTQDLPAEATIKQFELTPTVRITKNNVANQLTFNNLGQSVGVVNTTFLIGPRGAVSNDCRSVVLNSGLRLTTSIGQGSCPP